MIICIYLLNLGDLMMDERKYYGGLYVYGKKIVESSKYKGFYNLQNNPKYGNDDYSVPNYGKPTYNLELRKSYYIKGKYFDPLLKKPSYRYQLRIKF